jgi:hypothetical protein
MTDDQGLTRRETLRRGALVAGATVWAVPAVQTLAQPAFAAGSVAEDNPNCTGCLTGGGELIEGVTFQGAPAEVSFGLSPICCGEEFQPGTQLEVNVHKVGDDKKDDLSFHFDSNLVVRCVRDNSCSAGQPAYCANRFIGTIADAEGNVLTFDLTDCGEPGQEVDRVSLTIVDDEAATVLQAVGSLDKGNLQAHIDLGGPIVRTCECT